ncbi:MAG: LptA/OstA family protein [Phycisphaerales bacterium]|nr:LptA/OstA family protein [Phycisphaerales bacterium]
MPGPSGISTKTIGLIAAAILTLGFLVIIVLSLSSSNGTNTNNKNLIPPDFGEIPNITDTQTGGEMLVTMVDKDDPTRVAATLSADRFEPIGEGRRRLDNPLSWLYLKDGRKIKITADFATMLMPDPNQPPESGTLEGHIRIESYQADDEVGKPASVDVEPSLVAEFDEPVEFERRYLRLRSTGHFEITSTQFDFSGTDLTVILNELRDRVELVDVAQGDRIVIHSKGDPVAPAKQSTQNTEISSSSNRTRNNSLDSTHLANAADTSDLLIADSTQQIASDVSNDVIEELLNLYHIVLNDEVNAMVEGVGSAQSDRLELFAALNGSELPENSVKPIRFVKSNEQVSTQNESVKQNLSLVQPDTTTSDVELSTGDTAPSGAVQNDTDSSDIVITWSGALSVRPIDNDIPDELVDNNLALKLIANEGKGIQFSMPERSLTAQAFSATYLATRAELNLTSMQTESSIIKIDSSEAGSLLAMELNANLANGVITMPGRGQIASTPNGSLDPNEESTIQWKQNAEITLEQDAGSITDRLTKAYFEGSVIAKQGESSIGARSLEAKFNTELPSALSLKKITMVDGVISSASRSMLSGRAVAIDFIPDKAQNSIEPIRFESSGQVYARNSESMLKTEHIVATLYRDLSGETRVRTADAKGDIQYTGVDRTTASGESLTADGFNETMTLIGSPAKVAQGGSSIEGEQIDMNARHRGIEVVGKGTFDHDITIAESDENTKATGHIRASWDGSMRFDDAIGSIVCQDNVKVISMPDAYTRDTLSAHRAEIKLTPQPSADRVAQLRGRKVERELVSARIFGYAPAGQDPVPAEIESRTYAKSNPNKVISLIFLESSQIFANNQSQVLDVPSAGTLLILDRSEDDTDESRDPDQADTDDGASNGSGLTRFTWNGRMKLNRALGTATMSEDVLVKQKTLATGVEAVLSTDQLNAKFDIGEQDQSQSTRLIEADATGNVRFVYQERELLADSAIYDAIQDSLFASAIGNKLVTLYDDKEPAPMSAKSMKWDLGLDQVQINAPTPTRSNGGG